MSSTSSRILCAMSALLGPLNSTSSTAAGLPPLMCGESAVRMVGANAGFCSDSSIMVRSTSSTAVSWPTAMPSPSLTMCCALSIAWKKVGKFTTPSTLARGSSRNCSLSERVSASVPSLPISRCDRFTEPSWVYGFSFWLRKMSRL